METETRKCACEKEGEKERQGTKEQRPQSETRKRQNRAAARYRDGTSRYGLKNILCFFICRYLRATINDEICSPAWFSARFARATLNYPRADRVSGAYDTSSRQIDTGGFLFAAK